MGEKIIEFKNGQHKLNEMIAEKMICKEKEKTLIKDWLELEKYVKENPNSYYTIDFQRFDGESNDIPPHAGWIKPINDDENKKDKDYYEDHIYLSTHTFYGSKYKWSTETLQEHGFDVILDNWDKE